MTASHLDFIEDMTFRAHTLQQLFDIVFLLKNELNEELWFRGQGPYYDLMPSILRNMKIIADQFGRKRITEGFSQSNRYAYPNQFTMVEEFKNKSAHLFKTSPGNTFEWLCIMQHYGIPTTLLDWTIDPMIALFFATDVPDEEINRRIKEEEYGAEFWILPPAKLNSHSQFCDQNRVFSSNDKYVDAFLKGDANLAPIAAMAPHIEERLILQKGNFTIQGSILRPLNMMWHHKSGFIYKIEIPAEDMRNIKEHLKCFGHTHDYYYPNDETKYASIKQNELSKFYDWYEEYKASSTDSDGYVLEKN